jgi:GxxExxY protein
MEPDAESDEWASRVIEAAKAVHAALGPGFVESIYEEAMCIELERARVPFGRQVAINIQYRGRVLGQARLDLLIAGRLVVEIKAVDAFAPIHLAQVISYLRATHNQLGLLINFNVRSLLRGVARVVCTHPRSSLAR